MPDDRRLAAHIWIMAGLRRSNANAIPATVLRKGDGIGGTLMLKINRLEFGCQVLSQMRDLDGELGWLGAFDGALVEEGEADAYIARAIERDPDLWVIEIEDREGRHPFDGKML